MLLEGQNVKMFWTSSQGDQKLASTVISYIFIMFI